MIKYVSLKVTCVIWVVVIRVITYDNLRVCNDALQVYRSRYSFYRMPCLWARWCAFESTGRAVRIATVRKIDSCKRNRYSKYQQKSSTHSKLYSNTENECSTCGQKDSNFHGSLHSTLNAACLPIPPWPRTNSLSFYPVMNKAYCRDIEKYCKINS